MKWGNTTLTFNYFMEWILHMICFEFKIVEENWLTLHWLLRGECGESARDFNVIVLQHVNSNYGLKTVTRISPCHFAYILLKCYDLLFLFVDCTGCRIQDITIMVWLDDTRLHFHFAASNLFLGLEHSDNICTGQAKRHTQDEDQRNAGKVELECFVKACFIFIEIVKN